MRRSALITFALLIALVLPAQALALDQPDVIDDPPAAFNDTAATINLDDVPAAAASEPSESSQAIATALPLASGGGVTSAATPRGELPFTGPGDTIAAVLLGMVLIAAGAALRAVPQKP